MGETMVYEREIASREKCRPIQRGMGGSLRRTILDGDEFRVQRVAALFQLTFQKVLFSFFCYSL